MTEKPNIKKKRQTSFGLISFFYVVIFLSPIVTANATKRYRNSIVILHNIVHNGELRSAVI